MISNVDSHIVENTLQKKEIHEKWEKYYRTQENENFYEMAFDNIVSFLNAPANSEILDVGCGYGYHAMRLASRGFKVRAIDFSKSALEMAKINIEANGLDKIIKLQYENLLSLPFEDEGFPDILCWGVLMHIPDLEKALFELCRVLKKGGILVISEVNMLSMQSFVRRLFRSILRLNKAHNVIKTSEGIEYWCETPAGKLLTREANIKWLIKKLETHELICRRRISGQFTELYRRVNLLVLYRLIHKFNALWFKYIKIPYPAAGNILILQKNVDLHKEMQYDVVLTNSKTPWRSPDSGGSLENN